MPRGLNPSRDPRSNPDEPWRLLVDEAGDGAWNMAVDEAILDSYAALPGVRVPTLRLYGWSPPALSLGRSQAVEGCTDRRALREGGIDLIRRPTGGQAVLHDRERTYAVIGSASDAPLAGSVLQVYREISRALTAALGSLGLKLDPTRGAGSDAPSAGRDPSCFDVLSAHEIAMEGRKLVGSAQLRRGNGVLQHGSILLDTDLRRLAQVLGRPVRGRFAGLADFLGRTPAVHELDRALLGGFEQALNVRFRQGSLTESERITATRLRCWKYDSAAWTLEGKLGRREACWGP